MGGKSGGDPKMIVTRYYLSGHWGICQKADLIREIKIGEKIIYQGMARNNGTINIAREGLFGGMKKEGGAKGGIDVMLGGETQVPSPNLVSRLGVGLSNVPGFRGITSLFFYGGATQDSQVYGDAIEGDGGSDYGSTGKSIFGMSLDFFAMLAYKSSAFYWGTQPYLKPLWVTVQRIPGTQLDAETAPIPRGQGGHPLNVYFALDFSTSMSDVTSNGKTRFQNMKDAMYVVLDYIGVQRSQGAIPRIDIILVGYGNHNDVRQNITRRDINDNDISALKSWLSGRSNTYGTDFPAGLADAEAFFTGSPAGEDVLFFISDGLPFTSQRGSQELAEASADRIASLTRKPAIYGINIDLTDTQYMEYLDNTPTDGIPIVDGGDPSSLVRVIEGSVFSIRDANPAHVIYECLTDTDWGMGEDPSVVDLESFKEAGRTLFDEVFGVFLQWQQQATIEDFINNVLDHIQGAIFPHPRTGKITLKLLRDDLDLPNLRVIDPNNANLSNFSRKGWGETVNEIVVTWTNPDTEKEETVRAQSLANIAQQGGIVSSSKNYHGVRTVSLAQKLADRDLREESAPLCSCEVEVNREFWDITPFEGVKVTWPEFGLNELVMRVMKVNYGDSNSSIIRLSLMEDVFSLPLASYVPPAQGEWEDPAAPPTRVVEARLMPLPAYVLSQYGVNLDTLTYPDTGIAPMAVNPTSSDGASYDVMEQVSTASGNTTWEQVLGNVPFMSTAELLNGLTPAVQSLDVSLDNLFGEPPEVEDILIIGNDDLPDDELELVLVTSMDATSGNPNLLRGVLDTVPKDWLAGTKVAISRGFHWRPLPKTYVDGQSLSFKFLTSTSAGILEEYETSAFNGQAVSRGANPTRPANLKAFGELWPDPTFYPDYPVTITWSHRNRLLEDAVMLAWDEEGIPVESGVEYRVLVEAIQEDGTVDGVVADTNQAGTNYQLTEATIGSQYAGSPYIRVSVWAVKGSLESWQAAPIKFRGPFREPNQLYAFFRDHKAPENLSGIVLE